MNSAPKKNANGVFVTRLNNGKEMPLVQFGTWPGQGGPLEEAIYQSIIKGYRGIDTAEVYGTEPAVGKAVARALKEGAVKRADLFVTTKIWNNHHAKADVLPAVQGSLERLGLDYVDLVLVHWPVVQGFHGPELIPSLKETWQALEENCEMCSNYSIKKTEDLLSYCRIPAAVNQVECHPGWRNTALTEYSQKKGVHLSAWSPLGGQVPGAPRIIERPEIVEIAKKLGRTPGQIALRWNLQRGISVLPKTATLSRVTENLDLDFEIPQEDMDRINSMGQQARSMDVGTTNITEYFLHPEGPYKTFADLWDE